MELILEVLKGLWTNSGLAALSWQNGVMLLVAFTFLYLGIRKKFEPLVLVPIAFGMLLANLPGADVMKDVTGGFLGSMGQEAVEGAMWYESGVLRILYVGVKRRVLPCLVFLGVV